MVNERGFLSSNKPRLVMAKEVLDDAVTKKLQKEMDSHIEVLLI